MATGSFSRSDLNRLNHTVQNTQFSFIKEMIIAVLRDEYSKDSYYHYVSDAWGFPKTPDLTGKPTTAGYQDDLTTRIFIGEAFRHDVIFYPAILVRAGGSTYKPISINREKESIQYDAQLFVDGYGNERAVTYPKSFILAGAWEGQYQVDILTRDILARDEISSFCALLFSDLRHEEFLHAGILINKVNIGSMSEIDDRQQDKLYKTTISLDIRSEWRREIPIDSVVDVINICVEFGKLYTNPPEIDPNLTINTTVNLVDRISSL